MKLHRNAKTTPTMRTVLVMRVRELGWTYAEVAEALAISVRTVAKWLARYERGGAAALHDAPSRPQRHPRQTPPVVVAAILAARAQRWPGWKIGRALAVPRSTVGRVLRQHGMNRLAPLTPPPPVRRYEHARGRRPAPL
jgi:transposase